MTEPAKGACSSSNKKDQNSLIDEDIPTDFLSSWKSMSVTEDDAMDFNFEPVTKGKIKAFNFDKLDADFNLHSEFEKLSSFAVDMSHLDFSLPMEKSIKSTAKHDGEQANKSFQGKKEFEKSSFAVDMSDLHFSSPEESTKSKEKLEGGHAKKLFERKQENFSFSFDFNELDNFPIDPQLMKECNSSNGEEARGKVKSHNNDKFPDQITQSSNENGAVEDVQIFCEKSNIIMLNRETSTSIASSDKKESDLAQISPDKSSTVRGDPYNSMPDRDPSLPPPLSDPKQSDVSSVSSEKLNPTRTCEKLGKSHQAENTTSKQSFCQQATLDPSDKSLAGNDSTQAIVSEQMKICPAIDKLGDGLPEEDMCDGKSAASLASYDEESQLKDSHPQCVVETNNNSCRNSEHTEGNKDIPGNVEGDMHAETSVSGGPIISSADMKVDAGKKKAALKPVSGLLYRPMVGKDEVSQVNKFKFPVPRGRTDNIGDQALSTRGAFSSIGRNKIGSTRSTAAKERNDNGAYTDQKGEKLVGNPKVNAKETIFPSCESERSTMDHYSSREGSDLSVARSNNDLIMMSKTCHGEGTKSRPVLLGSKKNIKDIRSSSLQDLDKVKPNVSSMAAIERLKSNSVEQSKLSSPRPQRNVVGLSSLKILRNVRTENQSLASRTEVSSSLKKLIGSIEPQATTRMTNPFCIDIKTRSTPSSKRKYSDVCWFLLSVQVLLKLLYAFLLSLVILNIFQASYASPVNSPPSKRFSSCESRSPKDASRRITAEEVPGHLKLEECSSKNASGELLASTFDFPRDINMAKLGPPLTLENDKKIEKAEACSKELEDICNTLKRKHEEAKELLVRVIVNNNYLLMLNNPIYEDKLRNFLPDYYPKKFTQDHRVGRLKAKLGIHLN